MPHSTDELIELLHKKLASKNNMEAVKIGFYYNYRNSNDVYNTIDFNKETIVVRRHVWPEVFHYLKILNSYKLYTIVKRLIYRLSYREGRKVEAIPCKEDTNREL